MPLIQTKKKGPVSTAPDLPDAYNLQVTIPFADAMLLERLIVKRREQGIRPSKANRATTVSEAIRKLAEAEGVTYTPGEGK